MIALLKSRRTYRLAGAGLAVTVGFALASLVGVALARSLTVRAAKNAKVTNQSGMTTTEKIAVTSRGFAIYTLTGDSKSHPECTKANACLQFWPPVTVSSRKKLSKARGIKGKLGVWHRDGFLQVTLAGHPLYRYAADTHRHDATGEGIQTFGGTWHVVTPRGTRSGSSPSMPPSMPPTTCLYPPCY